MFQSLCDCNCCVCPVTSLLGPCGQTGRDTSESGRSANPSHQLKNMYLFLAMSGLKRLYTIPINLIGCEGKFTQ